MAISKLIHLLLLLPFVACSTPIIITSEFCYAPGKWGDNQGDYQVKITQEVVSSGAHGFYRAHSLNDLLKNENISCPQLDSLSILLENKVKDFLTEFLPFYSTTSVNLQIRPTK